MCVAGTTWAAAAKAPVNLGPPVKLTTTATSGRIAPQDVAMVKGMVGTKQAGGASSEPAAQPQGDTVYAIAHTEFKDAASCAALNPPGITVFNRYDKWADLWFKAGDKDALNSVTSAPGVVWVDIGRRVSVPPPPAAKEARGRGVPESIVRGGLSGLTGKGVIVAVVDSGIDFRHPDFITKDANGKPKSRLRYLWDTLSIHTPGTAGSDAPVAFPNGTSVGTLYTQDQLSAALRGEGDTIPVTDTNGHGTSCAGIAAGNGSALPDKRFTGVAPDADIIGVRVGPGPGLPNTYLLGAICTWLDKTAGSTPMVVSCSFGGQYGGRDGNQVLERQVSARFGDDVKGRAICIAAGNEGADALHAQADFGGPGSSGTITWSLPKDGSGGSIEVYFDSEDTSINVQTTPGGKLDVRTGHGYVYGITKQLVWSIDLPAGDGELKFTSTNGKPRKADAYIYGKDAAFTGACKVAGKQVGTPGTTANAITVGSYDWNNEFEATRGTLVLGDVIRTTSTGGPAPLVIGGLSSYSCPGYSRSGAIKPDVVAPGQFHIAPAPLQNIEGMLRHASGKYQAFNGTSAATPYTAGILALAFQKKGDLSGAQIRELLKTSASQDRFTGEIPNARWGYGKLDIGAAQKLLGNIK